MNMTFYQTAFASGVEDVDPDQIDALGNQVTWGQTQVRDPATGEMVTKWTQNETLNPYIGAAKNTGIVDLVRKGQLF